MIQIALIMCLLHLAAAYHFPIQKQVVGPGGENIDVNIEVDIDMSDIEEVGPVSTDPPPSHKPTLEPTPAPPIETTAVHDTTAAHVVDPKTTHKPPYQCTPVAHICYVPGAPDCCPELECQKDPDHPSLPEKCLPIRPSTPKTSPKPEECKPMGSRCVSNYDCCKTFGRYDMECRFVDENRLIRTSEPVSVFKNCLPIIIPDPEPKCQKGGEACTPGERNNPSEMCCPNHLCDLDNLVCVRVAYRSLNP